MRSQNPAAFIFLIYIFCSINPVFAVTNNTQALKLTPGGTAVTENPLVKNAKVTLMSTDFWASNIIVWQLTTTDATSNEPAWNSSNWSTTSWPNNECSANAPHNLSGSAIIFSINATVAGTDNKLQKVMSLLQIAQLTGMQVTIMGNAVTGDVGDDCIYDNITDIYLRNTTY